MRMLLLAVTLIVGTGLSSSAAADSWSHWGRYDRYRGWSPGFHAPYRQYNRHRWSRSYGPYRQGYGGSRFSVSFGRGYYHQGFRTHYGYRGHSVDAGALLGGVVLGSLLTSSSHQQQAVSPRIESRRIGSRDSGVYRSTSSQRVVTVRSAVSRPAPSTKLLRDLAGNCFEISHDGRGTELRTQVDPSVCNF